jgi:F0F1-type ATP synthase assembly protein I
MLLRWMNQRNLIPTLNLKSQAFNRRSNGLKKCRLLRSKKKNRRSEEKKRNFAYSRSLRCSSISSTLIGLIIFLSKQRMKNNRHLFSLMKTVGLKTTSKK